jgi:hypothetical protein
VWRRSSRRRVRPATTERLTQIELEWFFRDEQGEAAVAALFEVMRRWWPEALPRRFGTFEPLQHRFEDERLEGLLRLARQEWGMVFWSATRPFFDGFLTLEQEPSSQSENSKRKDAERPIIGSAKLGFDGRLLENDGWRADLIDGFVTGADRMKCVYAQAIATRNMVYSGGRLGADARTETWFRQVVRRDETWQGLPRNPVWLAWLGPPYRHLQVGTPTANGRLFIAEGPTEHPDAPPRQPLPVPAQWLVRGDQNATQRAPEVPAEL